MTCHLQMTCLTSLCVLCANRFVVLLFNFLNFSMTSESGPLHMRMLCTCACFAHAHALLMRVCKGQAFGNVFSYCRMCSLTIDCVCACAEALEKAKHLAGEKVGEVPSLFVYM